jgi:hypothetical protein
MLFFKGFYTFSLWKFALDKMTAGLKIPFHPHPSFGFTGA